MSTIAPTAAPTRVALSAPWTSEGNRHRATLAMLGADVAELVAVVAGPADRSMVPNVTTYPDVERLIASERPVDLYVNTDPRAVAERTEAALRAGWTVLAEWPFAADGRRVASLYDAGALFLGRASRVAVVRALGLGPGQPGAAVREITGWCSAPRRPSGLVVAHDDCLPLGADGIDLLAQALVVVERGGRTVVTVSHGHRLIVSIAIDDGAHVELVIGGDGPSFRGLEVRGPNGTGTLMLPDDRVSLVPPPSTVRLPSGEERVLSLPTTARCHELLLGHVLDQMGAGRPDSWLDDRRLMLLLHAIDQASETRERVVVDLP